jgi:hypothetical protein
MKSLLVVLVCFAAMTASAFAQGESCADPIVITDPLPVTLTGNTCGHQNNHNVICEYGGSTAPDIAYHYTPPVTQRIRIDLCNATYNTKLAVYRAGDVVSGHEIYCSDNACSGTRSVIWDALLAGGVTYCIVVDGYGTDCGSYTLWLSDRGATGENCADPYPIGNLPFDVTSSTCEAQNDYDWACPDPSTSPDVVFEYAPPTDQRVQIDLCSNTTYDSKVWVWGDGCGGVPLACSDDAPGYCSNGTRSRISCMWMLAGHTYRIVVDGADGACGTYNIIVTECGPASGENCDDAWLIPSLPIFLSGNTCSRDDDYDPLCPDLGESPDVVYEYVPPSDQNITLDLCGSSYNTKLYVFENLCSSDPIECNDNAAGICPDPTRSFIPDLPVTASRAYFIVVDGSEEECGDYTLVVSPSGQPYRPCFACDPVDADLGDITDVACGSSISGNCGHSGKWVARFNGVQDATYHFDLCEQPPCNGSADFGGTDPDIAICDAECNPITAVDGPESCNYHPNDWTWTCPDDGTYHVIIAPHPAMYNDTLRCNGHEGQTFTLVYYGLPPRSCGSCTPPDADLGEMVADTCSGSVSGNCGYGGKWVAQFNGVEGNSYWFDLCDMDPCPGSSDFGGTDPDVVICDAGCQIVACDDGLEECGYRPNQYQWDCPSSGTYYVVVAPYNACFDNTLQCNGSSEQTFTLVYSRLGARPCPNCTPPNVDLGDITTDSCGATIMGNCGYFGKWVGRFDGLAGTTYHWDLCPFDPCTGNASFDPDIVILDENCGILEWVDGVDTCDWKPNDWMWTCPSSGTYYVAVLPYPGMLNDTLTCNGAPENTFQLVYYRGLAPIPPGESCADAPLITGPLPRVLTWNTCSYQNDYDVECWQWTDVNARDVVYRYVPVADEFVTFSLCDAIFDPKLYLFADSCVGTPYACNDIDRTGTCPNESRPFLGCVELLAGHTYYVVVDAVNQWECGEYTLVVSSCTPGEGDVIQTAWPIPSLPYATFGTTYSFYDQYVEDCGGYSYSPDVVYAYSPPSEVSVEIDLCSSHIPTRVYVYENSRQTLITCDNDGCSGGRSYVPPFTMWPGNTYYIVIEGDNDLRGTYVFSLLEAVPGRCCGTTGWCWDYVTSRQCSYHLGRGTWTEGLTCADACPGVSPPPPGPIDSATVPVQNGCLYGIDLASSCDGELFYTNTCLDSLYTTNADGDRLAAVNVVINGWGAWITVGCWDGGREQLWVMRGNVVCLLDPQTGIGTTQFGTQRGSYDMDLDRSDSTLWLTEPEGNLLYHYGMDGMLLDRIMPLDVNGNPWGNLRGVCTGIGNILYVAHAEGYVTRHDKTTGAWGGLFAQSTVWQSRALTCDAASFAPQTVIWWKFDTTYYAYAVPSGTCECACPPADSVTVRLNAARTHAVINFSAPQAGTYKVFSSANVNAIYPVGFVEEVTLSVPAGRNDWTDPGAFLIHKRYIVVHVCG